MSLLMLGEITRTSERLGTLTTGIARFHCEDLEPGWRGIEARLRSFRLKDPRHIRSFLEDGPG
jgi:hypothetical protein